MAVPVIQSRSWRGLPAEADRLETLEVQLLLEGIYRRYGYDFRDYAPEFVVPRVLRRARREGDGSVSVLQHRLFRDPACMGRLAVDLAGADGSLFDPPGFYRAIRERVVPILRTYPFVRVWVAACGRGHGAYSLAVLLREEGLLDRCTIYATESNDVLVERARGGRVPAATLAGSERNYRAAGGRGTLSDATENGEDGPRLRRPFSERMVFARHSLANEASLNEFNLIVCRNVLGVCNETLRSRVHDLLFRSLMLFGFLGIGRRETLQGSPHRECFEPVAGGQKIYRRVR